MKVYIGPFKNWIGPYQIAEALCFWAKPVKDEHGFKRAPDWVDDFGKWLSGGDKKDSWLMKLCSWIQSKRKRTVKVRIDAYDTWNMDGTLAYIILPMLKQLQATKHGSPLVDDADVPEGLNLRSTEAPPKENEWDTDENTHKRWEWVLAEIIWTFEQLHNDNDWESQYHTGVHDLFWKPIDKDGNEVPEEGAKLYQMEKGPNDTHEWDKDGYMAHSKRIDNGLRLFGTYYRGLWD
jgi:hypothetical protein